MFFQEYFAGGEEKCATYWPEKVGEKTKVGDYTITNVEVKPSPMSEVGWTVLDVSVG